jgi:hypothetical protein
LSIYQLLFFWENKALPPRDVPVSEYINYIPRTMTDTQRMRQLLSWFFQKNAQDNRMFPSRNAILEGVKKRALNQLSTSGSLISWHKQPDIGLPLQIIPHPANLMNKEKLAKIAKDKNE